jgi:cyclic di-GMP phosphodiesterase Gmr
MKNCPELERTPLAQAGEPGHIEPQTAHLLEAIVNLLPVGVTVEGEDGRHILVNDVAAAQLGVTSRRLTAPSPEREAPGAPPPSDEQGLIRPGNDRTLLTSRRSASIGGERLRLTTFVDISERARMEDELMRRVSYDDLTGLPNRSLVRERVEDILARSGSDKRFALAFIDVDNFKHINDFYSHAIGDALLVKLTRRIADHLRESDMLARISGDEFVLVIDPVDCPDELPAKVVDLLAQLKHPFYIDGFEVFTSASIGVSVYPEHGRDYEALRRSADSAMYRAKHDCKGGAAFFDVAMGRAVTARMELEQRLRLAIRDRQFCCAYQPKVDIRTEEVVGLEALVRWRDGDGEIQGPSEFISLAVELGLIDHITHVVLSETVAAMDRIDEMFGRVPISINVAAKQAGNSVFMRSFADALAATGRADRFIIEVTEDAFVAKSRFQAEVLPMLRELGVRVSIDDFGTGYSSLSALADITADEIKVDRSFITAIHKRPRSQSVLKAIESLSSALGMTVVAEGVETFEELAYLHAATRIRYAQGYYFSKPFFLDDFVRANGVTGESRAAAIAREQRDVRGSRSGAERYQSRS